MTTAAPVDMAPYLHGIVEPTVRDVYRRYGDDVDLDDLRQEAAVWWYGPGQQYVQDYMDRGREARPAAPVDLALVRPVRRGERAAHRGYSPVDQVRYSPVAILQLLPIALDPDGMPDGGGFREGPKPKGNLAEGGDVLAMLVDVRRGVHSLTFEDQTFLVLCEDLAATGSGLGQHRHPARLRPASARPHR
jgi:hypothetical protein